jgi:hypothetical protein
MIKMKKMRVFMLAAAFFAASGYAAVAAKDSKDYKALAKAASFESIFPVPTRSYYFDTLDEAYDYVNIAQEKFTMSSKKSKAKGLGARLFGPEVKREKPVTVCYFILANDKKSRIDLTKIEEPLEKVIKDSITAMLFIMIFYEDRAASLANYHLASGWVFSNNMQLKSFRYVNDTYEAQYPIGWGASKVFSYLRKEIN